MQRLCAWGWGSCYCCYFTAHADAFVQAPGDDALRQGAAMEQTTRGRPSAHYRTAASLGNPGSLLPQHRSPAASGPQGYAPGPPRQRLPRHGPCASANQQAARCYNERVGKRPRNPWRRWRSAEEAHLGSSTPSIRTATWPAIHEQTAAGPHDPARPPNVTESTPAGARHRHRRVQSE